MILKSGRKTRNPRCANANKTHFRSCIPGTGPAPSPEREPSVTHGDPWWSPDPTHSACSYTQQGPQQVEQEVSWDHTVGTHLASGSRNYRCCFPGSKAGTWSFKQSEKVTLKPLVAHSRDILMSTSRPNSERKRDPQHFGFHRGFLPSRLSYPSNAFQD